MTEHPIAPLYDDGSKILILGSFPSVKSREQMFFYGHPKNRFWRVLSSVFEAKEPKDIEEKRKFLLTHSIALWDTIASCDIVGSSDSSIKNVRPNDIGIILKKAEIEKIFVNGKTAEKYYNKYIKDKINREAVCLPSTSPANASWSLDRLIEEWKIIR
ncbi:MAG: DNA-deoxyinosine glycosylase [Clostridia bacterium]|nr:DNA-deoxyinosine glycosylase [Clostridia bacterium]